MWFTGNKRPTFPSQLYGDVRTTLDSDVETTFNEVFVPTGVHLKHCIFYIHTSMIHSNSSHENFGEKHAAFCVCFFSLMNIAFTLGKTHNIPATQQKNMINFIIKIYSYFISCKIRKNVFA